MVDRKKRNKKRLSKKAKYKVYNWPEYNRSLRERGSLTVWIEEGIEAIWYAQKDENCRRGRQLKYSNQSIEMMLTLRTLLKLPLRQTEGFSKSLLQLAKLNLEVPEFSRLGRRSAAILSRLKLPKNSEAGHLIIDSTGIKVYGESEWLITKHGKTYQRKVWRKLHITVNQGGLILSRLMTNHITDDRKCLEPLLEQADPNMATELIADTGYDSNDIYEQLENKGIRVIIPPAKNAVTATTEQKKITLEYTKSKGYHAWRNKYRYGRRELVENTIYRYKTIIGRKLKSRKWVNQDAETHLGCFMLNKMTMLGMPLSIKVI